MSQDASIHDQTYAFFQIEAPELLQSIEENLFTLREERTPQKVHHLMRMTHTLKGAAASVGLKTIQEIAHSLEDIFKSFYNPEVEIDAELESLLFKGYEMLREPLAAELAGFPCDHQRALHHATQVFTSLQEKLGNAFDQQAELPTSAELGFDITESIFESGVKERLGALDAVWAKASPGEISQALQEQATVFLGLAESLSLPGFAAIATATLVAIANHPQEIMAIAQVAIADFKAARAAVLGGDRSLGGTPSELLQTWAMQPLSTDPEQDFGIDVEGMDFGFWTEGMNLEGIDLEGIDLEIESEIDLGAEFGAEFGAESGAESEIDLGAEFGAESGAEFGAESEIDLGAEFSQIEDSTNYAELGLTSLFSTVTGDEDTAVESGDLGLAGLFRAAPGEEDTAIDLGDLGLAGLFSPGKLPQEEHSPRNEIRPVVVATPPLEKPHSKEVSRESKTIRVEINKLKELDYLTGEMLIQQNHQDKTNQHVDEISQQLKDQVESHRQLLQTIREWADRLLIQPQLNRPSDSPTVSRLNHPQLSKLDAIELDPYGELHVLLQSALEETVQLEESAEAIRLYSQHNSQSLDKQKLLMADARENLAKIRMVPALNLFQRFDRMVHQLSVAHGKAAELQISGTQVFLDRFLVEKLYDPILHLLRNGFDHGLETPEERFALGKPAAGTLWLHAQRRDRWVVITIRDDGRGIDYDKILTRAIEKQLLKPEDANDLTEAKLLACLFEPGFSTASQLSQLSGRGIGLDVVKSQVEALEGWVCVQSEPFQGTTFSLHLPYELNIAKVIICQAKSQIYAFLAESIEQVIIPNPQQIQGQGQGEDRSFDGCFLGEEQSVPVRALATLLPYNISLPENRIHQAQSINLINPFQTKPLLILQHRDQRIALEVDQILSEQELVVRPLHPLIEAPSAVMGCCVLADGSLSLLLDGTTFLNQVFAANMPVNPPLTSALSTWVDPYEDFPAETHVKSNDTSNFKPYDTGTSNPSILVVDDSITLRQNLALTLEKAGFLVFQARDGQDALEQLHQYPRIGLVICDVEMPRMNGFEFLSRRSQAPDLMTIPVMMLTSRSGEKHSRIAQDLGANDYLTKPYLDQVLLEKVANFLSPAAVGAFWNSSQSWATTAVDRR